MEAKVTDFRLTFSSSLKGAPSRNEFFNIPDDLKNFLENNDGTLKPIVDNLYPDQDYEITIQIKSK